MKKADDLEALRRLDKLRQKPLELGRRENHASSESLSALSTEFENLLARMQTPEARRAMEAAFNASSEKHAVKISL